MKQFSKLKFSRAQIIATAILVSSATIGYAVTIPHTFTSGTTALAAQVNANFTSLGTAVTAVETTLATKANIADVYTKSEIDASVANGMKAAGYVTSSGTVPTNYAAFGTFTASQTGTGSYSIAFPGLRPGCTADWPLIMLTSRFTGSVTSTSIGTSCGSGDTNVSVQTRDAAGTLTNGGFNFVLYHQPVGTLPPFPARASASECWIDSSHVETCR